MEFDEMKKIWDSKSNQFLYILNNEAMQKIIAARYRRASRMTDFTEWFITIVNVIAGGAILVNVTREPVNVFVFLLALWMIGSAVYVWRRRIVRIRAMRRFDRTMLGDLNHAVDLATYQVRLSTLGRWNVVPVGIITFLALWQGDGSIALTAGTLVFLLLASWAAGWEHRFYKRRKHELELLRNRLAAE